MLEQRGPRQARAAEHQPATQNAGITHLEFMGGFMDVSGHMQDGKLLRDASKANNRDTTAG